MVSNLSARQASHWAPNAPFLNASDGSTTIDILDQNYTAGAQDGDQLSTAIAHASVALLALLIVVTFHGNLWVVLAILTRPHLRGAMANMFTVSLCCVDLLASTVTLPLSDHWNHPPALRNPLAHSQSHYYFTVSLCCVDLLASTVTLPLSLVTLVEGREALGERACQASAYTGTLSMLVSTLTLSMIACERLYSIALPMHQAAHASPALYFLLVVSIWAGGAGIAALPWAGFNSYRYSPSKRMCSLTWHSPAPQDESVSALILLVSFAIPTLVLITVYTGVFRVARKAARGVAPQPIATIASFPARPRSQAPPTAAAYPASDTNSCNSMHVSEAINTSSQFQMKPFINVQQATPSCSTANMTHTQIMRVSPRPIPSSSPGKDCDDRDSGIKTDSYLSMSPRSGSKNGRHVSSIEQKESYRLKIFECNFPYGCRSNPHPKIPPSKRESLQSHLRTQANISALRRQLWTDSPSTQSWNVSHSVKTAGYKLRPSHAKAFKTLLAIVLTHLFLWCPFFVCQLHQLRTHRPLAISLDVAVTWLSFLSYAVNPCLYGCLNRGIREELTRHLSHAQLACCCYVIGSTDGRGGALWRCGCRVPCQPRVPETSSDCEDEREDQHGDGAAESFFQFLQRTQGDED
ncbi:hypothetical protein EGW08_006229 [Elysia chlorotica]|uniref:G-protein coupled receptors family 1 profile domain-containing protein n=1 Tax=Elysia chlorotica TaxID=188477 RepID=A0A433TWW2_ELYCH|nr:hypothetical protein EGW08_006229 [Elysia chlorotica]